MGRKTTPASDNLAVHLRWLIKGDLPYVAAIEKACFTIAPWDEGEFHRCMVTKSCIARVAEYNERVIGYLIYELHNTHLRVINLAVDPAYQRRGVGRALMYRIIGDLHAKKTGRRYRIYLDVRESNLNGQLFLQRLGFRALNVIREYFSDTGEDAYRMQIKHGEYRE